MIRGSDTPTQHGLTNEMAEEDNEAHADNARSTRMIRNESQDLHSPAPGTLIVMHNSEDAVSNSHAEKLDTLADQM